MSKQLAYLPVLFMQMSMHIQMRKLEDEMSRMIWQHGLSYVPNEQYIFGFESGV